MTVAGEKPMVCNTNRVSFQGSAGQRAIARCALARMLTTASDAVFIAQAPLLRGDGHRPPLQLQPERALASGVFAVKLAG
jgi:hypothetical protein